VAGFSELFYNKLYHFPHHNQQQDSHLHNRDQHHPFHDHNWQRLPLDQGITESSSGDSKPISPLSRLSLRSSPRFHSSPSSAAKSHRLAGVTGGGVKLEKKDGLQAQD
jgi:hypothetical protein